MVLKIKNEHLGEIFEFARKCYLIEACGILVGKVNEREKIVTKVLSYNECACILFCISN